MSVRLERKPISMPEFWVGCIALASVALIACGGLRVTQPQNALPAPTRYASVSIQPSEASAKLPVEPPRAVSDASEAPPDVRPPDVRPPEIRLSTGGAMPIASQSAEAPRPAAADRPSAPAAGEPVGLRTQQPGTEADAQVLTGAVWAPPLSIFATRLADSQRRNVPDPASGRRPTFIGGGRRMAACAGAAERHHSSSAPAWQRRPAANVISDLSPERLQIGGGLRRHAPLRKSWRANIT